MATMTKRWTRTRVFSAREAAYAADVPEKTVQQAIDRGEIGAPRRAADEGGRTVAYADVVYLAVRRAVEGMLSAEGKRALREALASGGRPEHGGERITFGPLSVDVGVERREVDERLDHITRIRSMVTTNPQVLAGEPVVRDTRVSVYVLADLARQGAPSTELLEDYPSLTPETLAAALMFASLYPRRGRPRRPDWMEHTERARRA